MSDIIKEALIYKGQCWAHWNSDDPFPVGVFVLVETTKGNIHMAMRLDTPDGPQWIVGDDWSHDETPVRWAHLPKGLT